MVIKICLIIAVAFQCQVYGKGSVRNDTTLAIHPALKCSSNSTHAFDCALELLSLGI
jgi:hypothetical protein